MFGNAIKAYMETHAKMAGGFFAPYPDFLAVLLVIIFTLVLLAGVKLSSKVNIAITMINVSVITFIISEFVKHHCSSQQCHNCRDF